MAIDQQKVMQVIYDMIYDSLTMSPPSGLGRPATNANNSFLTLAFPGLPLDETQYADPWSPTHPTGLIEAAESMAWLVDEVPELSPIYSASGNSVDELYGQVVMANVQASAPQAAARMATGQIEPRLHPAPIVVQRIQNALGVQGGLEVQNAQRQIFTQFEDLTTEGQSIRTLAATPLFQSYLDKHAAYDVLVTQYMASSLQAQRGDDEDKAAFAARSRELEPKVAQAWRELDGAGRADVEGALEAQSSLINSSVADAFSEARLIYEQGKLASLMQPGVMWHQCLATPGNWMDPHAAMASVNLRSQFLTAKPDSHLNIQGPSRNVAMDLLRAKAVDNPTWTARPLSQESVDLSISFRFARVSLRRLWLNASLFSMDGWSLPGRPQNAFSTGTMTGNNGIFSLLPVGMIVARDVAVTARWAASDLTFITDNIRARTPLSLGPFAISGPLMHPKGGVQSSFLEPRVEGMTITVPGLSVVGYLNKLQTAMPPLGDSRPATS